MMLIYKGFFMLFAISLPVVVLIVVGRHVLSAVRSLKIRQFKFAFFSLLSITGILLLFAGVAMLWFGYGMAHTKKDFWSDLLVISLSALPIHGGGYGLWRLARYLDGKPDET